MRYSILKIMRLWFMILLVICFNYIFHCSEDKVKSSLTSAQIIERGLINVFDQNLTDKNGKMIYCEASAIIYNGSNLIIGSDKPIPDSEQKKRSPVFYVKYSEMTSKEVQYYIQSPFIEAKKYEDFTITPEGTHIIAITAFDRVHYSGSSEWDMYNTMLIWPVGMPDSVKVVSPTQANGITSSVTLREKISKALMTEKFPDGVPYFKVEGLAAIPNNKLLLGIREMGESYKIFDYTIKIISVTYEIVNDELFLSDDYQVIYDYDPYEMETVLGHIIALSSIEYDKYNNRLLLLTSYEEEGSAITTDEDVGAFLWSVPIEYLFSNKPPDLVLMKLNSTPLLFAHKGEGITVIDKTEAVVIHDDDRILGRENIENPEIQFSRLPHQAAYTVVHFIK